MKWKNKGYEYEYLRDTFVNTKCIYIYGDNIEAVEGYQTMKRLGLDVKVIKTRERVKNDLVFGIKSVVNFARIKDFNRIKNSIVRRIRNTKTKSPDIEYTETESLRDRDSIVLISMIGEEGVLDKVAKEYGLKNGKTVFALREWMRHILPVFMAYSRNKLYVDELCIVSTTRCTLNCEKCLDFVPYNKHRCDCSLEYLKRCMDTFFRSVDYIRMFRVTGGEPLMNKQIPDFLECLINKYSDRIGELSLITNGSIIPNGRIINILKNDFVTVKIDDYSKSVPRLKGNIKKWRQIIKKNNINGMVAAAVEWLDVFPASCDLTGLDDEQMIKRYDTCSADVFCLVDEKICNCNFSDFAYTAGVYNCHENEYYDLKNHSRDDIFVLIEFLNGFSEKGYNDFCRFCNGFPPINKEKPVPAAAQAKGMLECETVG